LCPDNSIVCIIDRFAGGWDTKYSWLLRAYVDVYFINPGKILDSINWASSDYPIIIPAIFAALLSLSFKVVYALPGLSLLLSILTIYYATRNFRQSELIYILSILSFVGYPLYVGMASQMYADSIFGFLLLFIAYNLYQKSRLDIALFLILLLPLVKREGIFYLLFLGIFYVQIFKMVTYKSLKLILLNNKMLACFYVIMCLCQYFLSNYYGGNKLSSAMDFSIAHIYQNLHILTNGLIAEPFKYFYLIPSLIVLIYNRSIAPFIGTIVSVYLAYFAIVLVLPVEIDTLNYINVTLDRVGLQIFPTLIFLASYQFHSMRKI